MSTSINNTMVNIEIPGVGMVSSASYAEFNKLREGYEDRKDIFDWNFNPYFFIALYNYYRAIGKKNMATALKNTIRKGWYHEGIHGITVGYLRKEVEFFVEIEKISDKGYSENHIYKGETAWEVLRDISLKVVLNYK